MSSTHRSVVTIGTKSFSALWEEEFQAQRLPGEAELRGEGWLPVFAIAEQLGNSASAAEKWCARRKHDKCFGRLSASGRRAAFFRPRPRK